MKNAKESFAVIIPDRGDRPQFITHLFRQMGRMTTKPDYTIHVNWTPLDSRFDLVERIHDGVKKAKDLGIDLVFILENDDFYQPDHFERFLPFDGDIFGDDQTTYYHLKSRTYKVISHPGRASLFTTGFRISAFEGFQWSGDQFLDLRLWAWANKNKLRTKFVRTGAIGMKHGQGLCGGKGHKMVFPLCDPSMSWIRRNVDRYSYLFYAQISRELWKEELA